MKTKLYFSLLAAIFLLGSCEKSDPTTDQSGNVVLINDAGSLSNHEGINVSIENTNLSTVTDASGNWTLKGLKANSQTIVFEKAGFGIYKQEITPSLDYQNYLGSISLPEIPMFSVQNLTVNPIAGGSLEVKGEFTIPGYYRYAVVLFGKNNSISGDPNSWLYCYSAFGSDSTFTFTPSISELYQNGFTSGNTIYVVAYGRSEVGNSSYMDAKLQKLVYGSLSSVPSNVVTIQLP